MCTHLFCHFFPLIDTPKPHHPFNKMNYSLFNCLSAEFATDFVYECKKGNVSEYHTKLINSNSTKSDLVDNHIENSPIITTSPTKSESLFVVSNLNLTSFRSRILIKRIFF